MKRVIYPKRFSRAKRKKLRAQRSFFFSIITLKDMRELWNSVSASKSFIVLGGNFVPKKKL